MTEKKSKLSWALDILLVLLLGIILLNQFVFKEKEDPGEYDYCVQWGGFIERDELVFQCYNFNEQKVISDYNIQGVNELVITSYLNQERVLARHQCTKYVKSVDVEYEEPSWYPSVNTSTVPIDNLIYENNITPTA